MNQLYYSVGYTLIDITNTGEVSYSDSKARNQHRNYETLTQVLGLRTQLFHLGLPEIIILDITNSKFGNAYSGVQKMWAFKFGIEFEAIFSNDAGEYGTLEDDFTKVPIILGLDETVTPPVSVFLPHGEFKNIYFEAFKDRLYPTEFDK